MSLDPIVIVSAARTPMGGLLGELSGLSASALGAAAIRAAVSRAGGIDPHCIDEVLMGNCLMAGQGQAPARQAVLAAGLPLSVGAVTLSKMCGSGLRALMFAHDMLVAGSAQVVVAGGMESMSNAPHLLQVRQGVRYGAGRLLDHMAVDGLEDAYERGRAMGDFAEDCVARYQFSRAEQDAFAIASTQRALQAQAQGHFAWEMVPVSVPVKGGEAVVERDEQPAKARLDKVPALKPAFRPDGTITAANASSISDGAAALVLMRASQAVRLGCTPLARVCAQAIHAQEPNWFTTAPVGAIEKVLKKAGWAADTVDLWEINEAFAAVTLVAMREFKLAHEVVNVHGGACALGHPIGASGARIVVTLLGALRQRGLKTGVAALCIGGGEAAALALEVV
ncbi:MAG: acetyl-CoA C-acyltransferase [Pseudomonadota bacterium]